LNRNGVAMKQIYFNTLQYIVFIFAIDELTKNVQRFLK